jgi:hypothetical protein
MHIKGTGHCGSDSAAAFLLSPNKVNRDAIVAPDCTELNDLAQRRENGYVVLVKMTDRSS